MPGMATVCVYRWQLDLFQISESIQITIRNFFSLTLHLFGAGELVYADGGRNIGQVVFVARRDDLVIPVATFFVSAPRIVRQTVQRHQAQALGESSVIRDRHAAFTGRDRLVCVERETGNVGGSFAASLPRLIRSRAPGRG